MEQVAKLCGCRAEECRLLCCGVQALEMSGYNASVTTVTRDGEQAQQQEAKSPDHKGGVKEGGREVLKED